MSKFFRIQVIRTTVEYTTMTVSAKDEIEAQKAALQTAKGDKIKWQSVEGFPSSVGRTITATTQKD